MALKFKCNHCGTEIIARFLKVGHEANCKSCGKKTNVPKEAISFEIDEPKKDVLTKSVEKNYKENNLSHLDEAKKESENETNDSTKKIENSIETPNDYPMMTFISNFFDFLAIINIVIGIIVFVVQASDGDLWFGLVALALSAISFGVCKLLSEVAKILSDIANNVKLIQINSESWVK